MVDGSGRIVLGSGFDARDLVAYACGVAAAMILEVALAGKRGVTFGNGNA